ncbi:DUF5805 domain-containing protein [Natronobacterium gregoryi]|uniref:Uncharacterized protein n=2 Tax=Natronobacterium gregoryi TaxID=44930 RepID=L0ABQ1_NATGS|nr:DUF5805 domain-containing protein [Natronobacterium gregoryi]AFZ71291.1 hypothetical protein Natgr_0017 [Natronobacterium gregoryi SP2]ELY67223.1 hypothetical protein C490_11256 [Natronobacterium gregoryi SP2]PLK19874.1 hypothetical protein CYV19_12745 [Natronobacterium gregoryi SP2]SFJ39609.1 hypothetical protein SAMN05443661_12644 [Natronobacterium gregoryi]
MNDSTDTSRKTVKTYVPAYQKAEWQSHADDLDMSQSEFVRTMVQAGRAGFESGREEPDSPDPDPRGNALETRILKLLGTDTYDWDELLEAVSDDIESRLDETLEELQSRNEIRYSGRHGGYTTVGDTDGN